MSERSAAESRIADLRRRADALDALHAGRGQISPDRAQPTLVGHHSEPGHRRMIDRAHTVWAREAADAVEARRLRAEADAQEQTVRALVFDDDPDAPQRLALQIERLEREVRALRDGKGDLLPLVRRDAVASVRRQIRAKRRRRDQIIESRAERATKGSV